MTQSERHHFLSLRDDRYSRRAWRGLRSCCRIAWRTVCSLISSLYCCGANMMNADTVRQRAQHAKMMCTDRHNMRISITTEREPQRRRGACRCSALLLASLLFASPSGVPCSASAPGSLNHG